MRALVVTNPFGGRKMGERITDPQEIEAVLAGEHAQHVVRSGQDGELAGAAEETTPRGRRRA